MRSVRQPGHVRDRAACPSGGVIHLGPGGAHCHPSRDVSGKRQEPAVTQRAVAIRETPARRCVGDFANHRCPDTSSRCDAGREATVRRIVTSPSRDTADPGAPGGRRGRGQSGWEGVRMGPAGERRAGRYRRRAGKGCGQGSVRMWWSVSWSGDGEWGVTASGTPGRRRQDGASREAERERKGVRRAGSGCGRQAWVPESVIGRGAASSAQPATVPYFRIVLSPAVVWYGTVQLASGAGWYGSGETAPGPSSV